MTVLELRQYTLRPGQRDVLIDIFDRHFLEGQEECGMRILGQFRDLDRPDRFVWLREFDDMESRAKALQAFYSGPVWKAHSAAANGTMLDVDDVLLLRPVEPGSGLRLDEPRPPIGAADPPPTIVHGAIWLGVGPVTNNEILGFYETEPAENNFPALPVRTDVRVTVAFARSALAADHALRLSPTARSLLR